MSKVWVELDLEWVRNHVGDAIPFGDIRENTGYHKQQQAYRKALDAYDAGNPQQPIENKIV